MPCASMRRISYETVDIAQQMRQAFNKPTTWRGRAEDFIRRMAPGRAKPQDDPGVDAEIARIMSGDTQALERQLLEVFEAGFEHIGMDLRAAEESEAKSLYYPVWIKARLDIARLTKESPNGAAALIPRYEQFFKAIQELPEIPIKHMVGGAVGHALPGAANVVLIPHAHDHSHADGEEHDHTHDHGPNHSYDHKHVEPEQEIEIVGVGRSQAARHV